MGILGKSEALCKWVGINLSLSSVKEMFYSLVLVLRLAGRERSCRKGT